MICLSSMLGRGGAGRGGAAGSDVTHSGKQQAECVVGRAHTTPTNRDTAQYSAGTAAFQ